MTKSGRTVAELEAQREKLRDEQKRISKLLRDAKARERRAAKEAALEAERKEAMSIYEYAKTATIRGGGREMLVIDWLRGMMQQAEQQQQQQAGS